MKPLSKEHKTGRETRKKEMRLLEPPEELTVPKCSGGTFWKRELFRHCGKQKVPGGQWIDQLRCPTFGWAPLLMIANGVRGRKFFIQKQVPWTVDRP